MEIAAFLEATVRERMGLKLGGEEAERFARRLDAWFRSSGDSIRNYPAC